MGFQRVGHDLMIGQQQSWHWLTLCHILLVPEYGMAREMYQHVGSLLFVFLLEADYHTESHFYPHHPNIFENGIHITMKILEINPCTCGHLVLPSSSVGKESACNEKTWVQSLGQEVPWRRKWQPTAVLLPGEFQGQRNLVGYSPWDHKELNMTVGLIFLS